MFWAWCSLLIRSGLILAAAEVLRRCLRRSAPSDRHRIVLAAFALLLVWPLFSALLPEIPILLWMPGVNNGTVTIQQTIASLASDLPGNAAVNWPLAIWLGGILLALIPVAVGHINVRRLVRRATRLHDECWQDSLAEECSRMRLRRRPTLLSYAGAVVPFTFGLRHPRILLPADCLHWKSVRRRAVLLHELAHIQRRDLVWQLFANLATALWWFQPLCWSSRWNLRRESERACDALVMKSGVLPSDYARELLEIAQAFPKGQRWSSGSIAVARRGELEGRLYAILDKPQVAVRRLPWAAIAALMALTVAASAVTIFPEQSSLPGGYNMKRTLISGLLVSAGLSAAAIGGSAFDAKAASPGREVDAKNTPAVETQPSDQKVVRVGGNVAAANLVKKVQPVYPTSAKSAKIQGTVELEVRISKEGVPEDLRVISSPSDDLAQSALDGVRQWRYRPTLLNGNPVAIITDVMVNYTLSS